ncbi:MAG: acyl--CoA ligase [Actinomycetota bacterium]|nr:acyl--CoA ligase [Actinomycetota bacterium]
MTEPRANLLAPSLEAACSLWADRPAITFRDRTISYAELWAQIDALGRAYQRLGVQRGDRIVCQLRNCPEHIVAIGAAWQAAAIHAGTDNDLTGRELAWLVDNTRASVLVYQPPFRAEDPRAAVRDVQLTRPETLVVLHEAERDEGGQIALPALLEMGAGLSPLSPEERRTLGPDDTALLLLTSGTTGKPKAVMETLPACWAKMQFFTDAFRPGPDDVMLLFLPIAHVFGLRLALLTLLSGGRLVLMDRFSPEAALGVVAAEGVTVLPGMPTHFRLLLGALDPDRHDVRSLRWAVSAASALPRELVEEIYGRLAGDLLYVYGCSENFTTLTTDREEILRGSVGKTVFRAPEGEPPDGTVRIVDPNDHTTPLPPREVGEIAFGARRPVHYWRAPDTATDGWYYTGDLGRLEEDGSLYVIGRLKELVNRGGLKVAPSEVEVVLADHPDIVDAAIVGRPDPVLGESICACIVPGDDGAPALVELRLYLGRYLARHKLPDELCVVERIPRTKIGKVDRPALLASVMTQGGPCERLRPR